MNHKFQFSLILLVFFMSSAALLFGWVYFDSVEKKYSELLRIPKDQNVGDLLSHIDDDQKRIAVLESQVKALQDNVIDISKAQSTIPIVQQTQSPILTSTEKVDLFADQKCLADKTHLDECVILAEADVKDNVHVIVKPAKPLTPDINTLTVDFYNGTNLITDFSFDTDKLFDDQHPIVTVVYMGRNDITLQYRPALDINAHVVSFDGSGWIEYQRNITQADVNQ